MQRAKWLPVEPRKTVQPMRMPRGLLTAEAKPGERNSDVWGQGLDRGVGVWKDTPESRGAFLVLGSMAWNLHGWEKSKS